MIIRLASVCLLASTLAAGAEQTPSTQPGTGPCATGGLPLSVRQEMLVTTDWLAAHLDDPSIVIVQVGKSRDDYNEGHIPGARFLAWSDVAKDRDGVLNELPPLEELVATVRRLGVDEGKRIVLYDDAQGISAARAYVVFDYLGLGDRAALLDGQLGKWQSESRPVTTDEPKIKPSDWKPGRLRPEIIVELDEMRKIVAGPGKPQTPVVDARSPAEYSGSTSGDRVPRPGHIPGAVNVPSSGNCRGSQVPQFRPVPDLLNSYAPSGAKPGESIVVYCRTGASASLDYFVSRYLGYNPRLYDGSFSQWSAQADTPVARTVGSLHVRVTESPDNPRKIAGPLPCRAWVEAGGERYYEPSDKRCVVYSKDRSFSCPGEFTFDLPPGNMVVHVERGKEYIAVDRPVKLEAGRTVEVSIQLRRWIDMAEQGWYSADWHVHFGVKDPAIMKQQALADDVNLLPVLGLWNQNQPDWPFPADQANIVIGEHYLITRRNQEIERIGGKAFESCGAPLMYGLVKPVFFEQLGRTWPPDATLVRQAKANSPECVVDTDKPIWGENVVTAAFGLFDSAQLCHNHYNRGRTIGVGWGMAGSSIEEHPPAPSDNELFVRTNTVYYRLLNCGFRLAATGGSAMGVMPTPLGYNRTYAKIDGPLAENAFIDAIRQGRTFATSGPALFLTVNGKPLGSTIKIEKNAPESLEVSAELQSIQPIDSLEIIQNGAVIKHADLQGRQPSPILKETLELTVRPERSGWIAARAVYRDGPGNPRQAHTSPIYVILDGKPVAFKRDALYMTRWTDQLLALADRPGRYDSAEHRQSARSVFQQARSVYMDIAHTAEQAWGD